MCVPELIDRHKVDTFQALYRRGETASKASLYVHSLYETAATEKGRTSGGGKHRERTNKRFCDD
jgi:hypothetical protein